MTDEPDFLLPLMKKTANGDREAFHKLYEQSSAKLFGVLLRILKQEVLAEDVCQEVYLTIWKKASQYDPTLGRVMSWMIAIARNKAIDVIRRADEKMLAQKATGGDVGDQLDLMALHGEGGIAFQMNNTVERLALESCLDEIEQKSRECVLLAYHYGLSRDELAERYSVPTGTIKTWLRRALLRLKDCLER